MKTILIVFSCLLLVTQVQAGELSQWRGQAGSVYKWTDDRGRVQYSQYPPMGVKYEEVAPDYPTPPPSAYAKPAGSSDDEPADKVASTAEKAGDPDSKKTSKTSQVEQNCIIAKKNLKLLEAQGALIYTNSEGKDVEMTDEARAEQLETAKQNIADFCK